MIGIKIESEKHWRDVVRRIKIDAPGISIQKPVEFPVVIVYTIEEGITTGFVQGIYVYSNLLTQNIIKA